MRCPSVRSKGPLVKLTCWELQGLHLDWRWSCWRCCRHSLEPESRTMDWLTDTCCWIKFLGGCWRLIRFCLFILGNKFLFGLGFLLLPKHFHGFGNIEILWYGAATDYDKSKNEWCPVAMKRKEQFYTYTGSITRWSWSVELKVFAKWIH